MIKYCFVYFIVHLLQLCPLEALSMGSSVPKPYPHHFVKHILSSCSWRDKTLQAHLHIAAPALNPACLQGVLVPLTGEGYWKWRRVHCAHPVVFYLRASFAGRLSRNPYSPLRPSSLRNKSSLSSRLSAGTSFNRETSLPSLQGGGLGPALLSHEPLLHCIVLKSICLTLPWLSCLWAQTLFSAPKKESDSERPYH